ncbi:unnamed protein product [Amoebophrya sp. A25]|nr:unnamed protein product [Amoebophrya sp. A25]|eukprot:GSA25T00027683001.1
MRPAAAKRRRTNDGAQLASDDEASGATDSDGLGITAERKLDPETNFVDDPQPEDVHAAFVELGQSPCDKMKDDLKGEGLTDEQCRLLMEDYHEILYRGGVLDVIKSAKRRPSFEKPTDKMVLA